MKHLLLFLLIPLAGIGQMSQTTVENKPLPVFPSKRTAIEQTLSQYPAFKNLTPEAKEWFYWTNYSRLYPKNFWDSVVAPILETYPNLKTSFANSLKKDLYAAKPARILVPNEKMIYIAQAHANDLAGKRAKPSHNSTNGDNFQQRMNKGGVQFCAAENISYGPGHPVFALVLLYIDEGLTDVGHRKNLMSNQYDIMGIGTAAFPNNMVMVVQDFGCTAPNL